MAPPGHEAPRVRQCDLDVQFVFNPVYAIDKACLFCHSCIPGWSRLGWPLIYVTNTDTKEFTTFRYLERSIFFWSKVRVYCYFSYFNKVFWNPSDPTRGFVIFLSHKILFFRVTSLTIRILYSPLAMWLSEGHDGPHVRQRDKVCQFFRLDLVLIVPAWITGWYFFFATNKSPVECPCVKT